MHETPQEYTQRILATLGGKPALTVQKSTPEKLATLVKRVDRKRLTKQPAPGKWSVAEILAHLADAELAIGWRLRVMLSSNGAPIQGYDQDVWASTFKYAKRDPKVSLETFRVLRENNLAVLKTVPKSLLENYYMHSERGKENVSHFTNMVAGHDLNHLRQIEQIVNSKGPAKR